MRSPAEQEAEAGGGWIVGGERKPNGKLERARIRGLLALLRCDSNESDVMLGRLSEKRAVDGEVFDISTRYTLIKVQ